MFSSSYKSVAQLGRAAFKYNNEFNNVLKCSSANVLCLVRNGSTFKFNKNIEFVSADDSKIRREENSFKVSVPGGERPLTVLMAWLLSKESHVNKFVKLYNHLGFDVLKVRVSPLDLLRPHKRAKFVASDMMEFLVENPKQTPILVHGFSVGAYVFCEGLVQTEKDPERYAPVLDRFVGQIWDSGVNMSGIPVGVPKSMTDNQLAQKVMGKYLRWFLDSENEASKHYRKSQEKMFENALNVPGLFIISKTDPVGTPEMNYDVYNKWIKKGHRAFMKEFDKSPHVSHYYKHKREYEAEMYAFLQEIGLLESRKKQQLAS